ncbi:hypothetical protein BT69DRAFT_1319904 [Atractiella rhizophila]|nr:hypothetical protein BT69DRAFT_1319904 [Atractiella rhizophila]
MPSLSTTYTLATASSRLPSLPSNPRSGISLPSMPSMPSLPSLPSMSSDPKPSSSSSSRTRPSRSRTGYADEDEGGYTQWASRHTSSASSSSRTRPKDTSTLSSSSSSTSRPVRPRSKSTSDRVPLRETRTKEREEERPALPENAGYYEKMKAWATSPEGGEAYAEKAAEGWSYLKKRVVVDGVLCVGGGDDVENGDEEEGNATRGYQGNEKGGSKMWDSLMTNVQRTVKRAKDKYVDGRADSDASDYEGESHLTRIMKEHHVSKATKTSDLPRWLFSDAELRGKREAEDGVRVAKERKEREEREKEWAEKEEKRLRELDGKRRNRSATTNSQASQGRANVRDREGERERDEYDPFAEDNYASMREGRRGGGALKDIFNSVSVEQGSGGSEVSVDSGYASVGGGRGRTEDKLRAMKSQRRR